MSQLYGGYFVSEEAEKAAKWDMLEEYHQTVSHLGVLENEFKKVSNSLGILASAFDKPTDRVEFDVSSTQIGVMTISNKTRLGVIPRGHIEFTSLAKLIEDYQKTVARKRELENDLGETLTLLTRHSS